jgi:Rod binding domain-containing protein
VSIRIDSLTAATPAATDAAPKADPKVKQAALQFEELLVRKLAEDLVESAGLDGGEEGEAASSVYTDMLPDALAASIRQGGGLGLAAELQRAIAPEVSSSTEPAAADAGEVKA